MNYCAVIGNPIAHSQSPEIHAKFAADCGISLRYDRILAEKETFAQTVQDFFTAGGRGLNITVPFKEEAFSLSQKRTSDAQAAGAVNTLWQENGILYGDNTDGRGLVQALRKDHHFEPTGKRILLIGAGGAARGVLLPLIKTSPAALTVANRTPEKAEELAQITTFPVMPASLTLDVEKPFDLIINATSTGLSGEKLFLSPSLVSEKTLCYDMVYGKTTAFMTWARENGCQNIADGYSMLVAQAYLSFTIWFRQ